MTQNQFCGNTNDEAQGKNSIIIRKGLTILGKAFEFQPESIQCVNTTSLTAELMFISSGKQCSVFKPRNDDGLNHPS